MRFSFVWVILFVSIFTLLGLILISKRVTAPTASLPAGAVATGDGSYVIATNTAHQEKFVSPKLGLSFLIFYDKSIKIKEVGNKVYIYSDSEQYANGNYIEILNKNPKDSLEEAMRKTILQGYSSNDCLIKTLNSSDTSSDSKKYAFITVPLPSNYGLSGENAVKDENTFMQAAGKCPAPYTQLNDVRNFVLDETHPNQFIFRNLGQSDYLGEISNDGKVTKGWSDTIQFTN